MSKNIRIRTNVNGDDNQLKIQLNQDFDFLEILSLKISQEDIYRNFYSDYGVVVGRVIMNGGIGVPNARISIFIPLTDEDAEDIEISSIYPYIDLQVKNDDGVRYNTLPNDSQGECHAPIGTFPTKRELIDNEVLFEVYEKYYKYTTTTNSAGDFMLFGVPVGNHILNVDVDLSDIGIFSQRPYDFIEQGNPKKLFDSPTKFKTSNNLNNLTQVRNNQVGVNIIPFWGEDLNGEVGITRVDVDTNYNIRPQAIFMGSIFGDNDKNSLNKNCKARRKLGRVCDTNEGEGSIEIIRKTPYGDLEKIEIEGGQLINEDGAWAFQVPMNLDYVVTDEFGNLVPSEDINKGIPTRAKMRFKIGLNETGGDGRLRTKAKYLVPNNPSNVNEIDYSFDESTSDDSLRDLYWNKIYTVKNHITRVQNKDKLESRSFIGLKDVDECVGTKNPPPFNKIDTDFNPIFTILCFIMMIIVFVINIVNKVVSKKFGFLGRLLCGFGCIGINCPIRDDKYFPGCSPNKCGANGNVDKGETETCLRLTLAEALNVFEFDFYNDWLNGALYSFLLKYKRVNKNDVKFCGENLDNDDDNNNELSNSTRVVNTNIEGKPLNKGEDVSLGEGVIVQYEDELYYKPMASNGTRLFPTDLYSLGAVLNCDWQGLLKPQNNLVNTSYKLPPLIGEDYGGVLINTGLIPLLFDLNCTNVSLNPRQLSNIRNICEIGVGLDDDDDLTDNIPGNLNGLIDSDDIEDELVRRQLMLLNDDNYLNNNISDISSGFKSEPYKSYRGELKTRGITTFKNSFYFYFGTKPNRTALDLMNSKFFTSCSKLPKSIIKVTGVVSNVTTVNGVDGSINITVSGGSPIINDDGVNTYIFRWYNELNEVISDTEDVNNLEAGRYFVVVKDNNDVEVKKTFIVRGIEELKFFSDVRDTKSLAEKTGEINILSITGGVKPYDIKITNLGDSSVNIYEDIPYSVKLIGQGVGEYKIDVSDSNTPIQNKTEVVTIGTPSLLVVDEVIKPIYCFGDGNAELSLSIVGGTEPYIVELEKINVDGDNTTYTGEIIDNPMDTVVSFTDLNVGDYRYRVSDAYTQTTSWVTFTVEEALELVLDRPSSYTSPDLITYGGKLVVSNLIIGVTYTVEVLGNIKETFVAESTEMVLPDHNINNSGYMIVSEDGCISNTQI